MSPLPSLDLMFGTGQIAATVTVPGFPPVATAWVEQTPLGEGYLADPRYSLKKTWRRGYLRLDHLPPAPQRGLDWPPPGTEIVLATGETVHVQGVDYQDHRCSKVIVR